MLTKKQWRKLKNGDVVFLAEPLSDWVIDEITIVGKYKQEKYRHIRYRRLCGYRCWNDHDLLVCEQERKVETTNPFMTLEEAIDYCKKTYELLWSEHNKHYSDGVSMQTMFSNALHKLDSIEKNPSAYFAFMANMCCLQKRCIQCLPTDVNKTKHSIKY